MHYSQDKLNELWDKARNSGAGLDGLERRARAIIDDEVEQRMSVPVEDGYDVVHYTRRSESELWKQAH